MSRLKKGGAVAAVAATLVGGFEGTRQVAYPDPATHGKPWTICMGHTEGVKPGDHKTLAECKALLVADLDKYADGMERCVTRASLPDRTFVAFVSFTYNVGAGTFCRSGVARKWNAGDRRGACQALMLYNRAAGIVFPGLTHRREKERALCLQGVADGAITP